MRQTPPIELLGVPCLSLNVHPPPALSAVPHYHPQHRKTFTLCFTQAPLLCFYCAGVISAYTQLPIRFNARNSACVIRLHSLMKHIGDRKDRAEGRQTEMAGDERSGAGRGQARLPEKCDGDVLTRPEQRQEGSVGRPVVTRGRWAS